MNLEDYRIRCGWSKAQMAREAGIDTNTLNRAMSGTHINIATADKLTTAISKKLGRSIHFSEIEGLNVNV